MNHPTNYKGVFLYSDRPYTVPIADEAAGFTVLDMLGLMMHPNILGELQIVMQGDGAAECFQISGDKLIFS